MKLYKITLFLVFCLFSTRIIADDMRPASLTVTAINDISYALLWKVPAKGNKRFLLDVKFDEQVNTISPRLSQFINNAYVETWHINTVQEDGNFRLSIIGLENTTTDVLVRVVKQDKTVVSAVLNTDTPNFLFQADIEAKNTFLTYVFLGIEHILVGFDHLLFVACLVFISTSRKKLFYTITGFTIAHSLTLIMATTGFIRVAIEPVEAVIALSIVFLAVEIAKQNKSSLTFKYPMVVSATFGLLHGFGFASVLSDIGLPENEKISALLYFNIGVEIGQLLFILVLFSLFLLIKNVKNDVNIHSFHKLVSYFSGSIAMIWLINRLSAF